MKFIFGIWIFLIGSSAFAQTGSIEGSAFFKYNDLIGNRPDAGSSVRLFYDGSILHPQILTTDINGQYQFKSLTSGKYILIVKSKETNRDPYLSFTQLVTHSDKLQPLLEISVKDFRIDLQNEIERLKAEWSSLLLERRPNTKKIKEKRMAVINKIFDFYELLPREALIMMGINTPTDNLDIHELEITDESHKKIPTAFGVSYTK